MAATSKAQFNMMKGICEGTIAPRGGLTKASACEFIKGQTKKNLPTKAKGHTQKNTKKGKRKTKKKMK